jgi:hypothetical protein
VLNVFSVLCAIGQSGMVLMLVVFILSYAVGVVSYGVAIIVHWRSSIKSTVLNFIWRLFDHCQQMSGFRIHVRVQCLRVRIKARCKSQRKTKSLCPLPFPPIHLSCGWSGGGVQRQPLPPLGSGSRVRLGCPVRYGLPPLSRSPLCSPVTGVPDSGSAPCCG